MFPIILIKWDNLVQCLHSLFIAVVCFPDSPRFDLPVPEVANQNKKMGGNFTCHLCGEQGHKANNCPTAHSQVGYRERGQ